MAKVSRPNTFTAGTNIVASQVNDNENTIYNEFNGNIDNDNIKASAGIVDTKLAQISTASKVATSALTGTVTNVISTTNITTTTLTATTLSITTITATNLIGQVIETVALSDYFATSNIIGWASSKSGNIYVKKIGKTVHVYYYITGTGNNISSTFTLPYICNATTYGVGRIIDSGSTAAPGLISMAASDTITNLGQDLDNGAWTASGTRTASGQFSYESIT